MKYKKNTAKFIKKAIEILRKCGIKEPYCVQVKNPKGDGILFKRVNTEKRVN